jgi:hypothetical protein
VDNKVIVRGYVKWTDKDGVFHKEMLADHPDMLAKATEEQKAQAEEVVALHKSAEKFLALQEEPAEETEIKSAAEETVTTKDQGPLELLKKQTK